MLGIPGFYLVYHRSRNLTRCSVLDLGKRVKESVLKQGMLAWQYNTIGVSDAITMGGEGTYQRVPASVVMTDRSRHAILSPESRDHR